jgi:LysR family transcriptional regulator, carnitine catabolism transcriptional activator
MELHQLRCAIAVADYGSFTAAASALHLTQPAVSYTVRKLEREVGVELFRRLGTGAQLTSAGEGFLPAARETLRNADRVEATMAEITGVVSGRLEVTAPRTLVPRMARMVGAFRQRHAGVVIDLLDAAGDATVLEHLRSSRCELGFLRLSTLPNDLRGQRVAEEEFVAVFPPGTDLPPSDIGLDELAQQPLIAPPRATPNRHAFEQVFASYSSDLRVVAESAHPESILELVWAGAGASLASLDGAAALSSRGLLTRRIAPPLVQPVHLAHHAGPLSPAANAFLPMIDVVASLSPDDLLDED